MSELSYEIPVLLENFSSAAPKVDTALENIKSHLNGKETIAEEQLDAATKSKLAAKATGLESQKSIIATEETRESASYGTLTTPDEVTVTLPENGLIAVAYQATWKESVSGAGRGAIFLGASQLKTAEAGGPALGQAEAKIGGGTGFVPLSSGGTGLKSVEPSSGYTGDVTTGQAIGTVGSVVSTGPCYIFAAAGTYKVSVQFKASSGKVTVKSRKLWAWTIS